MNDNVIDFESARAIRQSSPSACAAELSATLLRVLGWQLSHVAQHSTAGAIELFETWRGPLLHVLGAIDALAERSRPDSVIDADGLGERLEAALAALKGARSE